MSGEFERSEAEFRARCAAASVRKERDALRAHDRLVADELVAREMEQR